MLVFLQLLLDISHNLKSDLEHIQKTHIYGFSDDNRVLIDNDLAIAVVFLFRHTIELYLKNLFLTLKSKECIAKNEKADKKIS